MWLLLNSCPHQTPDSCPHPLSTPHPPVSQTSVDRDPLQTSVDLCTPNLSRSLYPKLQWISVSQTSVDLCTPNPSGSLYPKPQWIGIHPKHQWIPAPQTPVDSCTPNLCGSLHPKPLYPRIPNPSRSLYPKLHWIPVSQTPVDSCIPNLVENPDLKVMLGIQSGEGMAWEWTMLSLLE